jgi:hypothetical protein
MLEFLRSRRSLGVVCGFVLLFAGLILALPGIPGPGIPLVVLGLVILSSHFSWAKGLLDWVGRKSKRPSGVSQPLDIQSSTKKGPIVAGQGPGRTR